MISKETCVLIWNCHNEIDKANELLKQMAESVAKDKDKKEPLFESPFGDKRGLQLGIPYSDTGRTLYGVSADLGIKVIEQHIQDAKRRLQELMTIAKIELSTQQ